MGFVKAYFSTEINKQILGISKPVGALWLLSFMLFIAVSATFLNNKKWFYIAFVAVCVSQILIIMAWKEAKFGTIINIIILLVAISAFVNNQFHKMV
jgi:hypothetical protein